MVDIKKIRDFVNNNFSYCHEPSKHIKANPHTIGTSLEDLVNALYKFINDEKIN